MSPAPDPAVDAWLAEHRDDLVAFRRHMHAHPELSGEEFETTELVRQRLEVAGITSRVFSTGVGLMADLTPPDWTGPDDRMALRADLDALAMEDETDTHYCSKRPGVAHACGHDVHTTITLGTALYFAQHPEQLPGPVRLIFQPAEERVPGGAKDVVADGALDGVESVLGLHCDPKLDVGSIGLRAGPISSAADMATIELSGPGGHTARPELTVDLVSVGARVVSELPGRIAKAVGGSDLVKFVFGSIRAGDAANVIPTHCTLKASVRTPSDEVWERLPELTAIELHELLADTGAAHTLDYVHGVPPVVNHADAIERVRRAAERELGPSAITPAVQSWGGDDFAWYGRVRPAAYVRLGVHDPASTGPRRDLHVGDFDVDERSIDVGVRLLTAAVREHFVEQRAAERTA